MGATMTHHSARLYELITEIRAAFRALANLGDALHADVGVTSAMRAIMERLSESGPETVPQIARAKSVSRQSVQQVVDALLSDGLVEARPNPAHKRSPLIAPTRRGGEIFGLMRQREAEVLSSLAPQFSTEELAGTVATLTRLTARVRGFKTTSKGD